MFSEGNWDGTNNKCIFVNTAASTPSSDTTHCIRTTTNTNNSIAAVTAADATTFTLTWTKNNSPTGNVTILVKARAVA